MCVVSVANETELLVALERVDVRAAVVALMCTICSIDITEEPLFLVLLDGEVEYGPFVAVVDARDAGHIALSVVSLHFIDNLGGNVLEHQVAVVSEELLAVHKNLADVLAVEGIVAVIIYHDARQFLDEVFHHRAFRQFECIGIIGHRIVHNCHLRQFPFYDSFCHYCRILAHHDVCHLEIARALRQGQLELLLLKTHERYL